LVIIEAYYGLSEHIYKIEAGMIRYKLPESAQEYANNQLIPVTK
jgi:hypothetical protein